MAVEITSLISRGHLDGAITPSNYSSSRAIAIGGAEDIAVPAPCQTGRGIVAIAADALTMIRFDTAAPAAFADVDDGTSGFPIAPGNLMFFQIPQGCAALKLRAGAIAANIAAAFYVGG